jgi:hypothetical protein
MVISRRLQNLNHKFDQSDETGSISPLIIFYFTILVTLIFLISNVASAYIARRDLISRTESALLIASQELDDYRYYYGSPITSFLAEQEISNGSLRVPIDCADASRTFEVAMTSLSIDPVDSQAGSQRFTPRESKGFGMSNLQIESISCDGYDLAAKVSELHELPFQLRVLGIRTHLNRVEVGTSSFFLAND